MYVYIYTYLYIYICAFHICMSTYMYICIFICFVFFCHGPHVDIVSTRGNTDLMTCAKADYTYIYICYMYIYMPLYT